VNTNSKLPKVGTTIFSVMSALANEHKAINLSQGFPNFDCSDKLKKLVNKYIEKGYNQYAPMPGVPLLRERIAKKIESSYGTAVDPDTEITITAGATQAIFTAIAAFVQPGDEVIIFEPAYDSYRPSIEVFGGFPIVYQLEAPDYSIDWNAFSKLITQRTRMIIINTPHNPTGTTLKQADLLKLQQITDDSEILVLSDEVYEHLVFDGLEHQSTLRFPNLFQRTLATYSFGKTFHNTGWKIGYCVAPKHLMKEFRKVHQFNVFSVNTPLQYGIADFLSKPKEYLGLNAFYQEKRDYFLEVINDSRFKPIACEGTYFQLVDYSAISNEKDTEFVKRLTIDHGVAAIPVSAFCSSQRNEKVIRFCFAKTEKLLKKAGKLLSEV
jgi:methionine transaminase